MLKRNTLWLASIVLGASLFLIACAPSTAPAAPAPTQPIPTTKPGEASPTPKPVQPTLTPSPEPVLAPKPGAKLAGPIDISGKASGGTISLTVGEDGTSIVSAGITLKDLKCDGFSAGSMMNTATLSSPITKGSFAASASGVGEIKGQFISPTDASGTINIVFKMTILNSSIACDLGTWNWNAKAQ